MVAGDDALDRVPRGLRLARGDGHLAADEALVRVDLPAFGRPTSTRSPRRTRHRSSRPLLSSGAAAPARPAPRPRSRCGGGAPTSARPSAAGRPLARRAEDRHRPATLLMSPPTVSTSSSSSATPKSSARSSDASWPPPASAVAEVLDLRSLAVVLVGDLSDDLLEDVLDGDHRGAAVLVDDDGEVRLVALHLAEQVVDGLALGTKGMGRISSATGTPPASGSALSPRIVLEVEQADDVVDVLPSTGITRSPSAGTGSSPAGRRGRRRWRPCRCAHHDLAGDGVAELEDRVDHLALPRLDERVVASHVDEVAQLALAFERAVAEPLPGVTAFVSAMSNRENGPSRRRSHTVAGAAARATCCQLHAQRARETPTTAKEISAMIAMATRNGCQVPSTRSGRRRA